ncbi:MAG TPA: peptidylprolyl isomerase [Planktothrix sp.]|jgi:cyclophilin family peptidyl-prolyl cis-trans isomerase
MANPVVVLETTKGTIKFEIFVEGDKCPKTAQNFIDLVNRGFYNGLTFHRYEPGFVIQGGCPRGTGSGGFMENGKERRIPLEVHPTLKHDAAGVVAMARADDPNSASSQFYITLDNASFLDMKYAVFGKVTEGLDAAKALRAGDSMTKVYELAAAKH